MRRQGLQEQFLSCMCTIHIPHDYSLCETHFARNAKCHIHKSVGGTVFSLIIRV